MKKQKLRVSFTEQTLELNADLLKKTNNKITPEVIEELTSNLIEKINSMDIKEKSKLFATFSLVSEDVVENVEVGLVVDLGKTGPGVVVKVNKKTANVVTAAGVVYSCGLGGLKKSSVTLEEFMKMRTYTDWNKKESGAFYEVLGKQGFEPCILIESGKKYKLFTIKNLKSYFTLTADQLSNERFCKLVKEVESV